MRLAWEAERVPEIVAALFAEEDRDKALQGALRKGCKLLAAFDSLQMLQQRRAAPQLAAELHDIARELWCAGILFRCSSTAYQAFAELGFCTGPAAASGL